MWWSWGRHTNSKYFQNPTFLHLIYGMLYSGFSSDCINLSPFNLWHASQVSKLHQKNKFGPLPGFVNKVLLEHCHAHSLMCGCLHAETAHLSSCGRDGRGHKAGNITWLFTEKSLPIMCVYYTLITNLSITKDTIACFLWNSHIIQDTEKTFHQNEIFFPKNLRKYSFFKFSICVSEFLPRIKFPLKKIYTYLKSVILLFLVTYIV